MHHNPRNACTTGPAYAGFQHIQLGGSFRVFGPDAAEQRLPLVHLFLVTDVDDFAFGDSLHPFKDLPHHFIYDGVKGLQYRSDGPRPCLASDHAHLQCGKCDPTLYSNWQQYLMLWIKKKNRSIPSG